MSINDVLADVYGFLDPAETELLYTLASQVSRGGNIVELGSYHGRSTIALAMGARLAGATVYAVDHHPDYMAVDTNYGMFDNQTYYENIARHGVGDVVKTINLSSVRLVQYWCEPIDLLWIDASHEYEDVKLDFNQWSKHVAQNDKIAMHDTSGHFPDVSRFVEELLAAGAWKRDCLVDATSVFSRVK